MKKIYLLFILTLAVGTTTFSQIYYPLSTGTFTQDWSNTALITANDDWAGYPNFRGFLGQNIVTGTGVDPQTILAPASLVASDLDVIANQAAPNTLLSGGVAEFDGIANPSIAIQGSGTADVPFLTIYLNASTVSNIIVQYNLRDLDGSTDNSIQPVALQYRIGNTGNFINIPAGFVADASSGPSIATLVTPVNVTLPAACDGQAQVELRIITANAAGNDEWIGIDDISITSTPGGADLTPPTVTTLTPTDNATNVSLNTNLQILFNEPIAKGTGDIVIKRSLDNSVVQTIDVTTAAVVVAGSTATITINPLLNTTGYYVEIAAGSITDIALNNFAGIVGNTTWNFTTLSPPAAGIINNNYSFTNCATTFLSEGWSQFSVTGAQTWACTTAGRTGADGIVMNAFVAAGNNPLNEDWLISPVFDLTSVSLPTLKFYSKGDFTGNSLQLKISNNYVSGTNPNTATWTNLVGNFPPNVPAQGTWTLSDNIDLSAFNTAGVTIAWVYINPTTANSSRWTIDDVTVYPNIVLQPCIEPIDQPTNLVLTPTAVSISGTFTEIPLPTSVLNYLVVRSLTTPLTQLPVDATTYSSGQIIGGGNGTVIGISDNGTFTDNNVLPSTQYYYFIFAMEDQSCTGSPNYNQLTPLTATVTTPALAACVTPASPTALALTPANTTVSGTFTGSAASKYLVVRSASVGPLGATPVDGTAYTIGQVFGNGTIISIAASTSFVATGLTVATPYYFYVFALNDGCTGAPFYNAVSLNGTSTTTNTATGIPAGYYDAAAGLNCQPLKTAVKNIISTGYNNIGYTPGIWNIYQFSELHRNDANTEDIIWDMYSDNPTGPEPYIFKYGPTSSGGNQCGTYANEGDCYNREHSTPQSWFASASPMVADVHHIFGTDGKVNSVRSNFPYGEVTNLETLTLNGSKLGTGNNFGYTGTVFEPIDAYKGDFARAGLYMITRYEDEVISQNWSGLGTGNSVFLSTTDEPNAANRRLQMYDAYYLKTLVKWHNQDPVSQKEIDRNNVIYYTTIGAAPQGNRNPFVDHPEYVAAIFQCTGLLPVTLLDFVAKKNNESILLTWYATQETSFKKYEIERSVDGITFNKIGEVEGRNLASYNFTDNDLPRNGIAYYRLKMIDVDGQFKNSKIIFVKLNNKSYNAVVYPNPTTESLNVKLYEVLQSNSVLQITDVAGRLVMQQTVNVSEVNINLDVKNLSAGRYFIKIANATQIINQSFVVMK